MVGGLLISGRFTVYERSIVACVRSLRMSDPFNSSCDARAGIPLYVLTRVL